MIGSKKNLNNVDISNYIKDILYTHNQVNIPEFGAFIRKTESAKIGENNEVIQAPTTQISFDETIKNDDNILTNYLVQNGGIKPDEAKELVAFYVSELKSKLEKGETESFNQIGKISLDDKKTIIFTKDNVSTFLPNTFALAELKVTPIVEKAIIPEKEEKKKPIWIWIAIAAAIVIILILVFPVRNYVEKQKLAETEKEVSEEILQSENDFEENDAFEQEELDVNSTANTTAEELSENENAELKFHIIAGSFSENKNAENLKLELIKKGYSNSRILLKDDKWYRVSMASFADRKSAENEMKKINSNNSNYEIWLFALN